VTGAASVGAGPDAIEEAPAGAGRCGSGPGMAGAASVGVRHGINPDAISPGALVEL
jgi:hypothetical protein